MTLPQESNIYRYNLQRAWDEDLAKAVFILLNPSTANEKQDDPTIRRCISFTKSWGCGALQVVNLYARREPKPAVLLPLCRANYAAAVGSRNDEWLDWVLSNVTPDTKIIAAWGCHAQTKRVMKFKELAAKRNVTLYCLGVTKRKGAPRHPLYVRGETPLQMFLPY